MLANPKLLCTAFHGHYLYHESFPTRAEAMERERYYKTGRGRDELDQIEIGRRGDSPRPVFRQRMKLILFVTSSAILGGALIAGAQEAADVDLQSKQPAKTEEISPSPPNLPEISQLDEMFKQTSLGKEADEQRLRVEWRQLKNQLANDPDLIATRRAAEKTRTDLQKRVRLRSYYKLYFAKIRLLSMSPEMKQRIDGMEAGQLNSTSQSRVRPSPSPSASATPAKPN